MIGERTMVDELNCNSVRSALWDYAAETLGESERESVTIHLRNCRECSLHRAEVRSLRTGLKTLPEKNVSSLLSTRLKVVASRERSRMLLRRDLAARLSDLRSSAKLLFDNLLRPLAVPATGGILASFFCIAMILNTLHFHPEWQPDIPVSLFTQVTIEGLSPFSVDGPDVTMQLTVDPSGAVSDFELPDGDNTRTASPQEMKEIGNMVLFSTFTPATSFGQRVSGKIVVGSRHINIRG
ncbi:MAG: zf-HC2 domain-containing protein [Bryobacteraceae bacterium]